MIFSAPFSRSVFPGALFTSAILSIWPSVLSAQTAEQADETCWTDGLDVSATGGLRFEDNLVVDALDVSSAESDFAAIAELDLGYEDQIGDNTELRTGYLLEDRRYFEEQDFNLQLHYTYLDLSRDLAGVTAGARVDVTYARVGGESLLNKQMLSGYVSDLVTRKLYVRSSLSYENTRLDGAPGRDNQGQRLDGSAFYFLDGTTQYLTAKARYHREDADDAVYDYQSPRVSFGYVQRLSLLDETPVRIRADWRYEIRRYDEVDPGLNAKRRDYRQRWRVRLDAPVTDSVTLELKAEHRNYNSNNQALDFDDNRIEMLVEVALL
ncbi:porin family protein [Marinobacter halotolerans]|uniref:surface lipoprotein assembly modifier n=1 Tax=Marinobacter halotolerans TaxID=1569211 RepID=UPI0012463915|nr:surface lipoprotein assembly modifier [Marinobacter halotolerans]